MYRADYSHLDSIHLTTGSRAIVPSSLLHMGYQMAERVIEEHSKSFAFASKFLQTETKRSVVALYAFCRMVDDIVDESVTNPVETNQVLDELSDIVDRLTRGNTGSNPILLAFGDTIRKHNIPVKYVHELIEGVRMDLTKAEYQTFDELYLYAYRVASTVGLMMTHIFHESPSKSTLKKAESLGIAMQLTNILRDVKEDYLRGRVYIPRDWLNRWDINPSEFMGNTISDSMRELIQAWIEITNNYYKLGYQGVKDLPAGADFVVHLSGKIYQGILGEIEKNDYQILQQRHYVSKIKKILIAARLQLKYRKSLKTVKVLNSS